MSDVDAILIYDFRFSSPQPSPKEREPISDVINLIYYFMRNPFYPHLFGEDWDRD
jgi:hypothetical protein